MRSWAWPAPRSPAGHDPMRRWPRPAGGFPETRKRERAREHGEVFAFFADAFACPDGLGRDVDADGPAQYWTQAEAQSTPGQGSETLPGETPRELAKM
jgi:hypothetical protein